MLTNYARISGQNDSDSRRPNRSFLLFQAGEVGMDQKVSSVDYERVAEFIRAIRERVGRVVVGQEVVVERTLIALFTGGHLLLQGVPGLAKTPAAHHSPLFTPSASDYGVVHR